jgi:hypothetical protein
VAVESVVSSVRDVEEIRVASNEGFEILLKMETSESSLVVCAGVRSADLVCVALGATR